MRDLSRKLFSGGYTVPSPGQVGKYKPKPPSAFGMSSKSASKKSSPKDEIISYFSQNKFPLNRTNLMKARKKNSEISRNVSSVHGYDAFLAAIDELLSGKGKSSSQTKTKAKSRSKTKTSWKKTDFEVIRDGVREHYSGFVRGVWGVTRVGSSWPVIHIPSGMWFGRETRQWGMDFVDELIKKDPSLLKTHNPNIDHFIVNTAKMHADVYRVNTATRRKISMIGKR